MNVFPVATILLSSLDKAIQEFNGADRSSSKRRLAGSDEAEVPGIATLIDAINYGPDAFLGKITKVLRTAFICRNRTGGKQILMLSLAL
jgi:hypothetical protein